MWYANVRCHSTSGQTWTSLNHVKNVLSCVNRSYHFLSDRTATLGRQPLSRNVWLMRVKTPLDGILRSGKRIWYSSTAACALPLQNPYTKCMSQYSTWENTKGIVATPYKQLNVTQTQLTLHSSLKVISTVALRISCAGCSIWNRKKPPLFSGHYLRNRSTLDMCFGLYRYTLTYGTLSRSLTHSSWDTLYILTTVL